MFSYIHESNKFNQLKKNVGSRAHVYMLGISQTIAFLVNKMSPKSWLVIFLNFSLLFVSSFTTTKKNYPSTLLSYSLHLCCSFKRCCMTACYIFRIVCLENNENFLALVFPRLNKNENKTPIFEDMRRIWEAVAQELIKIPKIQNKFQQIHRNTQLYLYPLL